MKTILQEYGWMDNHDNDDCLSVTPKIKNNYSDTVEMIDDNDLLSSSALQLQKDE